MWDRDLCGFSEVTVGLGHLRNLVSELSPLFLCGADGFDPRRRAMLMTMPGDQHRLGMYLIAEFLRRAGWVVSTGAPTSRDDLAALVGLESFAVVGVSVGCDASLETVAACVRGVRELSRNRAVGVLVGGPAFLDCPRHVATVGADGTAADALGALSSAETHVPNVRDLALI
jgi:methylmalonyl-CoA mutase cobalamin-binding subunit